jgi:AAA+ superfamily predicted ATPase
MTTPAEPSRTQSLRDSFRELIIPLRQILREFQEIEEEKLPDAVDLLLGEVTMVALLFMSVDRKVSDEELSFVNDLRRSISGETVELLDSKEYDELCQQFLRLYPKRKMTIDHLPSSVNYLLAYDAKYGTVYAGKARSFLVRFAHSMVKADNVEDWLELNVLTNFKDVLFSAPAFPLVAPVQPSPSFVAKAVETAPQDQQVIDGLMNELNSLVGLDNVKEDVKRLVDYLQVQSLRKAKGMDVPTISNHLVFDGNPGTGKTTVARLISKIYKALGLLNVGHVVETSRADLIAGYLGQTALKVKGVIETALGGILFIDEAYSLTEGNNDSYGQEAVQTLLKLMEDHRDSLIVIVAGYPDKMREFLDSNPGFHSRFNKFLTFEDYSPEQLVKIFESFCTQADYQLSSTAREVVAKLFLSMYERRDRTFGNARLARNLFEITIGNQASRIMSGEAKGEELLSTIESVDTPASQQLQQT